MGEDHETEPVFIRSRWGTNRYVYNPANPAGLFLIAFSLLVAGGVMYGLRDGSSWSEGELHDAVHTAAASLEARPQLMDAYSGGYQELIRREIEAAGEGPEYGGVNVALEEYVDDGAGAPAGSHFEVGADDVEDLYCLRISPPEPETVLSSVTVRLSVSVTAGRC